MIRPSCILHVYNVAEATGEITVVRSYIRPFAVLNAIVNDSVIITRGPAHISIGECNTILSAYTLCRHLG